MIKLIAIDLDGTLLNSQKEISPKNQEVLKKAKAQGVKIVLCTGRPLFAVEPFMDVLGLREAGDYSITFNGGFVQQNDTGEVLVEYRMETEQLAEMYNLTQKLGLPLDVIEGEQVYHVQPEPAEQPSIYQTLNPLMRFAKRDFSDFGPHERFNKMVVATDERFLDQQINLLPKDLYTRYNLVKSRKTLLEILHKDVSKANGIARLIEKLGIQQAEVMALGDEENDLSMIEYAGIGVAMANASAVIKTAADEVTASNDEDGVALAVERFVLQGEK